MRRLDTAKTEITLPMPIKTKFLFNKWVPIAVTDWARGNGAINSPDDHLINGVMQRSGIEWCAAAHSEEQVQCRGYDGKPYNAIPGGRKMVVRPRIINPEKSGIDVNENGHYTVNGNPSYYPRTIISGKEIEVVRNINLPFTSDKTQDGYYNKPFDAKQNESYEILVDGKPCFATKSEYTRQAADSGRYSCYSNDTFVENARKVWFLLEPILAEKQADGSIQILEGMLPVQFERNDEFEKHRFKNDAEINVELFQIGGVLNTIVSELENSAELMAELTTSKQQAVKPKLTKNDLAKKQINTEMER